MSISKPPVQVTPGTTIQLPLSRRGAGPGLILIVPNGLNLDRVEKTLDPPPLQKWAEESYSVAQILIDGSDRGPDAVNISDQLNLAVEELKKLPECSSADKIGVVVLHASLPPTAASAILRHPSVAAVVFYGYYPLDLHTPSPIPVLAHLPFSTTIPSHEITKSYSYPNISSGTPYFTIPSHESYNPSAASVSHTRTLSFLKPLLNGPYFDLEKIWDEHTYYEFADRSVEETMATMVEEPYVNHVPTMTGGVGRKSLTKFYTDHFIFSNPEDAKLELVSRTVGIDRIVDEFLFKCTHDRVIDWLIPGIPPTFKPLSIPFTSIVNIRGDRLYHEHIAWDQGTVLRQLGLLPEYLPFPYPVPGSGEENKSEQFEYRVPVAGVETARKLVDEASEESNAMIGFSVRKVNGV